MVMILCEQSLLRLLLSAGKVVGTVVEAAPSAAVDAAAAGRLPVAVAVLGPVRHVARLLKFHLFTLFKWSVKFVVLLACLLHGNQLSKCDNTSRFRVSPLIYNSASLRGDLV